MMKNYKQLISAAILVTSIATVHAGVPTGPYVEGNLGYSKVDGGEPNATNVTSKTTNDDGLGYNVNLGWQFVSIFGLEAGYTHYSDQDFDTNIGTVHGEENEMFDLDAKVTLPVSDKFDVFAKAGPAVMHHRIDGGYAVGSIDGAIMNGSNDAFGVTYGGGVEYNFTDHISFNVQANGANPTAGNNNDDLVQVPSMYLVSAGVKFTL